MKLSRKHFFISIALIIIAGVSFFLNEILLALITVELIVLLIILKYIIYIINKKKWKQ